MLSYPCGRPPAPPQTGSALLYCLGKARGLFSRVLQLVWGRTSFPTPAISGSSRSLAAGGKSGDEAGLSPLPTPPYDRWGQISHVPAPPSTGSALLCCPGKAQGHSAECYNSRGLSHSYDHGTSFPAHIRVKEQGGHLSTHSITWQTGSGASSPTCPLTGSALFCCSSKQGAEVALLRLQLVGGGERPGLPSAAAIEGQG